MDRNTLLWTLVLFFGASLLFRALHQATRHSATAVTVAVQVAALALLIGAIFVVVRQLRRR
jgi:hypothetical protein